MRESDLPSAGLINGSQTLRRSIANAISYVQIAADRTEGTTDLAQPLIDLLEAAIAALTPLVPEEA